MPGLWQTKGSGDLVTAHDDIAEVRASFEKLRSAGRTSDILKVWCDDGTDALDRVEALLREQHAEIARLTELNSGLTRDFNAMLVEQSKQRNRAEAAEREAGKWRARAFSERREVARLRERLRHSNALLEQAIEHMEFAHYPQTGD